MSVLQEQPAVSQELRDNLASFRLLAENVKDCAIYLLDPQGLVATWNTGAQRMKLYAAEEIVGRHISVFYLPEDAAAGKPEAELARALADGRAEDEGWRLRQDGTMFRAHVVITPVYDSAGKHLGFGKVTRDISRDLTQEHMRSVLDHVPDGILSTDDKGLIQSFNLAAEAIFGYEESSVISRDGKMLLADPPEGEQDSFLQGYLRNGVAKTGGAGRLVTGRRSDGSTFPMELAISSFEQEGRVFFTGIVRDVSDRSLAADALLSSQQRMASAQQQAHVGDWEIDLATGLVTWSDELCRIYGVPLGLTDNYDTTIELMHAADRPHVAAAIDGVRARGGTFQVEYRIQRTDGGQRYLEARGESVPGANGEPAFLRGSVQDITDRKLAEEALRHSKQRMENAQRVAHVGDWEWDITQDKLAWSDEYYRIFGLEPQSLRPDLAQWLELIHPDDRSRLAAAMRHVVETKGSLQFDHRLLRPDGELRYVEGRGEWMLGHDGQPIATGVVYDVTDRINEALRLRAILENVPDSIFMVNNHGLVQSLNRAGEELTGYSAAELIGQPVKLLSPEKQRPQFVALLDRMFRGEQSRAAGLELLSQRKDGTVFPIDLSLNEFALGGEHYIIGVARDATERRDREARLRAILDNATDAIITVDENGIVQSFNSAAESIYGYTEAEMSGKEVFILAPEEERTQFADLIQRMCRGEQTQILGMEGQGQRKDDTLFQLELSLNVFAFGDKHYVIGLYRDTTQRKKLEEQLRQSQKMEAIGNLAGGVAHDFNNMLTVITAYSEIVLAKLPAETELREFVGEILLAGERAALLTSQLLAFSRQQVLAPRVLNLNSMVVDTERMLRRLIGEDVEIASALDAQLYRIRVDQGQIVQVIMNLAVNARDAMPQGGKLTIETTNIMLDAERVQFMPECQPGPYVVLSVSDTGTGMSPEVKARIFEPFFTTKGPGKGTGLGLATVYGIVKQSGGNLQVYSELGHGTTFKIYIPAVAEDSVKLQQATAVLDSKRGTETILLAEDDNAVRKVAVTVLESRGYKVLVASRGAEALELVRGHAGLIDLLLTDLIMPEMSGRQLAEAVAPLLPGVKILYMSGYTDDTVVRHGLVSNSVAFLQKPFTSTSLVNKVREVLDGA